MFKCSAMGAKVFMIPLFCITNRLGAASMEVEPWLYKPNVPESARASKEAFDKWAKAKNTEHCFYYGYECENPVHRPGRDNPVRNLRAIIADYDIVGSKKITDVEIESVKTALPEHLLPTFAHTTFNGGARLVWLLESPIPCGHEAYRTALLKYISARVLKLNRLLPGLDERAYLSNSITYDVGTNWRQVGDPLSPTLVEQWCFEASTKTTFRKKDFDGIDIPLEAVEAEIEKRWPGRWQGSFEVGKRGPVFFRDDSTNPTASVVTEKGMVCFSTEKIFYTWEDIFGQPWVESFVQDKVGRAVRDVFFDGKNYWYQDDSGRYVPNNKEVFQLFLRSHNLDPDRPKAGGLSQLEAAMNHVHQARRVDMVVPLVYIKRRFIQEHNRRVLNISHLAPIEPADGEQEWGPQGSFPWLSEYFDTLLDDEQRTYFLAWWRWYYMGAIKGTPNKGHAVFISGPVSNGKTFLSTIVVGSAMGGHYPATRFLLGETQFNKGPSEASLWTVDDASPAQQETTMHKFSEKVKQLVVNGSFEVRAMYRDGVDITWSGRRLIITLNDDPVSLRMLPPLDNSIDDKVMFFKTKQPTVRFSQYPEENEKLVRRELPYMLRWLVDWQPPSEVMDGRSRLAVRKFVHPELREGSLSASGVHDFLQVLDVWFVRRRQEEDPASSDEWAGTSADLLSALSSDNGVKELVKTESVRTIGRKLGQLVSVHTSRVAKASECTSIGGSVRWKITAPWVTTS